MRHINVAIAIAKTASLWSSFPVDVMLTALRAFMIEHLPKEGQPLIFNKKVSRCRTMVLLMRGEIVSCHTPYMTIINPQGHNGSADHAVCVVDNIIFDARLPYALKLTEDSLNRICGRWGMANLGTVAVRFCMPHGVKKRNKE
jgi:hypothetical protein